MAVTRDATGVGGTSTGGVCTASHTIVTPGASTVVLAFVAISVSSSSTITTCSVTYGGAPMTELGLGKLGTTTNRSTYSIYYLFNPAAGVQSCVATPAGSSTKSGVRVATVSYTGVSSIDLGIMQESTTALTLSTTSVPNGFNVFGHINGVTMTSPNQSQRVLLGSSVLGVGDYLLVQDAVGTGSNITFSVGGTATTPGTFGVTLHPIIVGVNFDSYVIHTPTPTSPNTGSHTINSLNTAVIVAVGWAGTGYTDTSATHDGVPMTKFADQDIGGNRRSLWGLLNPSMGTKTVVVTTTAATTTRITAATFVYTNVDSFGTVTTLTGPSTPASMSATGPLKGRIVQSFGAPYLAYNRFERWNQSNYNPYFIFGDAPGTGAATTFTATSPGAWAGVAVPLLYRTIKVETLTDDFATQDTAKWNYYGTASATGGRLSLPVLSSYAAGCDTNTKGLYDLTGSSALVEAITPAVGAGGKEIFFEIQVDSANGESMYVSGSSLYFREKVGGTPNQTSIPYNATTHRWWRMRESGGSIFWDTSPDGTNWVNQRSKVAGISVTSMLVLFSAGYYGTESASTAFFDNLNVPPLITPPVNTSNFFAMF